MASTFNVLINTFLPQYQGKVICAVKYTISLRVPWFSSKFCSLLLPAAFSPACWNLNVNPMNRTHKYAKQKTQNLTCPTSELDLFQCSVNPTPNNSEKQNQWFCLDSINQCHPLRVILGKPQNLFVFKLLLTKESTVILLLCKFWFF